MSKEGFYLPLRYSVQNITVISVVLFFSLLCLYATKLFFQFTALDVFMVGLTFFVLLYVVVRSLMRLDFNLSLPISLGDIVVAVAVLIMLILAVEASTVWMLWYYPAFPLLNVEIGAGWHPDPVFHVSAIRSIMENGYPSTSQHGSPVLFGHYLSHYVDALILTILGIDPYQSYGLLFLFKVGLFLTVVTFYAKAVSQGASVGYFLGVLIVSVAFLTSTWSVVGSHALWVTCVLLVAFSGYLFKIMGASELSYASYAKMFLIILILSLGKVSVGLMLTCFLGCYFVIRFPRDWRLYVFGLLLLLFFQWFSSTLSPKGELLQLDWDSLTFGNFIQYVFAPDSFILHTAYMLYAAILVAVVVLLENRKIQNIAFLGAALLSTVLLFVIVKLNANFISADVYYFEYSLAIILVVFLGWFLRDNVFELKQVSRVVIFSGLLLLSVGYFVQNPSVKYIKVSALTEAPYAKINALLPQTMKIDVFSSEKIKALQFKRPLQDFKYALNKFVHNTSMIVGDFGLFIPKDIFDKDIARFGGKPWAKGMLVYAALGYPLVYANSELYRGYGYQFYDDDSLQVSKSQFSLQGACKAGGFTHIIEVLSFKVPAFKLYSCH